MEGIVIIPSCGDHLGKDLSLLFSKSGIERRKACDVINLFPPLVYGVQVLAVLFPSAWPIFRRTLTPHGSFDGPESKVGRDSESSDELLPVLFVSVRYELRVGIQLLELARADIEFVGRTPPAVT